MAEHRLKELLESASIGGVVDGEAFAEVVFDPYVRLSIIAENSHTAGNADFRSAAVQDYVRMAAEVLTNAFRINPDESRVLRWFNHERLKDFGSSTPAEIVVVGRSDALIAYVESLGAGASG